MTEEIKKLVVFFKN